MATANRRPRSTSPPATDESSSRKPPATATAASLYFPPELIPRIASRLTSLQDFFALRAACRAYRALLPLTASNLASQAPFLLVPRDATRCPALFHRPLSRIHRFRLPRTSRAGAEDVVTEFHTLGCRVAIVNSYSTSLPKHELSIVHLLTGERVCLPSPPAAFSRVLLSGDLVVAQNYKDIFYCRFGAPKWRVATCFPNVFVDLILVKDTLYALVTPGKHVAIVELPDNSNGLKLAFLECGFDIQEDRPRVPALAECRGELLLVIWQLSRFHVLQWQSGERKWVRITSLGGCSVFFVGQHFSGWLGPDQPGIRGDCIYYKSSDACFLFSLIDQSADKVADNPILASSCYHLPPHWVFPSMC